MSLTTIDQWIDYFQSLPYTYESREFYAQYADQSHAVSCPILHVGGTNGKGSTIALLEATYRSSGLNVATFTSPHLVSVPERLKINGVSCSEQAWVEAFAYVNAKGYPGSVFAALTLSAMHLLSSFKVDVCLMEVGLGGRRDPVRLFASEQAIITSIGLDHQRSLGATREAIAMEKIGIARPGSVVFWAEPEHYLEVEAYCDVMGIDLRYLPSQNHRDKNHACMVTSRWEHSVWEVIEYNQYRWPVSYADFDYACATFSLDGRGSRLRHFSNVLLDVCHNHQSVARMMARKKKDQIFLLALAITKDPKEVLGPMVGQNSIVLVDGMANMHDGLVMKKALIELGHDPCLISHVPALGLWSEVAYLSRIHPLVMICGSFLLVGMIKREEEKRWLADPEECS